MPSRRFSQNWISVVTLSLTSWVAGSICAASPAPVASEYQIKAAFHYNLARFVEWPSDTFRRAADPITICVLGRDPFGPHLEEIVDGKSVDGHGFVVRRIFGAQDAGVCQIVFISSSEQKHFQKILDTVRNRRVLTVGDTPGFAGLGGVINLVLEGSKVRIEVNQDAAKGKNLRISSRLLGLARTVKSGE
jgi:hypothetical protein